MRNNSSNGIKASFAFFPIIVIYFSAFTKVSAQNIEKYISRPSSFVAGYVNKDDNWDLLSTVFRIDSLHLNLYGGIIKTDTNGNIIWENEQNIHSSTFQTFLLHYRIQSTFDGGFISVGTVTDSILGSEGMICRFDSSGNLLWCKRTVVRNNNNNSFGFTALEGVERVSKHTFIVTGPSVSDSSIFLMKIDDAGGLIWSKHLKSAYHYPVAAHIIRRADANDYYIGGTLFGFFKKYEGLVLKVDSDGNILWSQSFVSSTPYGNTSDMIGTIVTASDGAFAFLLPQYDYYNHDTITVAYCKPDGTLKWLQALNAPENDQASYGLAWNNDDLVFAATSQISNTYPHPEDLGIVTLDTAGGIIKESYKFDLGKNEEAGDVITLPDGSLVVEAQSIDSAFSHQSLCFMKLTDPVNACGHLDYPITYTSASLYVYKDSIVTVAGSGLTDEQISNYFVQPTITDACTQTGIIPLTSSENKLEVFPNPATDFFNIQSNDPAQFIQSYQVFDVSGKRLMEASDFHALSITVHPNGLPPGMYFIKVAVNGKEIVQKIIFQ